MKDHIHIFSFNPECNDNEQLILETKFLDDCDWYSQELVLYSHGNHVVLRFGQMFTPENLRKLADELEATKKKVLTNLQD
jgi:hypothetical protein